MRGMMTYGFMQAFGGDMSCNACKCNRKLWRREIFCRYKTCHLPLFYCAVANHLKGIWHIFVLLDCANILWLIFLRMPRI